MAPRHVNIQYPDGRRYEVEPEKLDLVEPGFEATTWSDTGEPFSLRSWRQDNPLDDSDERKELVKAARGTQDKPVAVDARSVDEIKRDAAEERRRKREDAEADKATPAAQAHATASARAETRSESDADKSKPEKQD